MPSGALFHTPRLHAPRHALAAMGLLAAQLAGAQTGIYTCVDDKGRRLTSDRPIVECISREQRILNKDGSSRGVLPPTLTAEERAVKEARDREAAKAQAALNDAVRRDRNLLVRYPDEATHNKAREAALDNVRFAIRASEKRLEDLKKQRQPLLSEAEFFKGKVMPQRLKSALDANETATKAQTVAAENQQAELARVNQIYDRELHRLRELWSGAAVGSRAAAPAASGSGSAATAVRR